MRHWEPQVTSLAFDPIYHTHLAATQRVTSRIDPLHTARLPRLQQIPLRRTTLPFGRCFSPNPPKDTDGRREESGRGVRELQGK